MCSYNFKNFILTLNRNPFKTAGECRGDDTYSKVSSKQLCCVPKSYSSFSIVYFDVLGNIMVGEVPGIITQKCSCIRDQ